MEIKIFEFNPISEHTYIAYDDTKECVIIDAGCYFPQEQEELLSFVAENKLQVKHIINTHLHFDHIFGVNLVTQKFGLGLEAHQGDEILLHQYKEQLRMFGFPDNGEPAPKIEKYLTESDTIAFGNQEFEIYHIPGHSLGSIVFYNKKAKCVFVGDVLFRGSVGRSDLAGGDHNLLISGIRSKLLTLPDETVVYSGHGPSTTIGFEKRSNQFLV